MKYLFALLSIIFHLSFCQFVLAEAKLVSVEPGLRRIKVTGFTRAHSKMPLISEVSGKVSAIFANIGNSIPETGRFACLDDTFVDIDIKSAKSEMNSHYSDIKYLKKEVTRHKKLVKKQTSAVSVLDGLVRDLGKSNHALSIASLKKDRLEELKSRYCIKAPAGWLVMEREIEVGQWINQGEILAQVGNYSELIVPVSLSQPELTALQKEVAKLELFFPDVKLKAGASIEHISPAFDEKTRKILVDLLINQTPEGIRGGMRVSLSLYMPDDKNASFIISIKALEERFEEYWVERKDGKRFRVKLLSELEGGLANISSAEIRVGDQFKVVKR